jgi:hypothetical protein
MNWGFIRLTHFNHTLHENVHNIQGIPDRTLLLSYGTNFSPIGLVLLTFNVQSALIGTAMSMVIVDKVHQFVHVGI